jgi:ATP-dependent Lon protease
LSSKIQNDVASIAKTQRDFFLREQMRAIQRELGEGDPNAGEAKSLREKIAQASCPPRSARPPSRNSNVFQQMPPAAAEYAVSRNYLDWILALPWEKSTEDKLDLKAAEKF